MGECCDVMVQNISGEVVHEEVNNVCGNCFVY